MKRPPIYPSLAIYLLSLAVSCINVSTAFSPSHLTSIIKRKGPCTRSLLFPNVLNRPPLLKINRCIRLSISPLRDSTVLIEKDKKEYKVEHVPRTMRQAIRRFFFGPDSGPGLVFISTCGFIFLRCGYVFGGSQLTFQDAVMFLGATVFWWFQEHWIHGHLLHSEFDWIGKQIHKAHHEKPYHHISIDPPALLMGWLLSVHVLLQMLLPMPLALSATIGYALAGFKYEWTHYIVHTKVNPRSRSMRCIRDNHMRHHILDNDNWLGFSVLFVDRIFGTSPDVEDIRRKNERKKNQADTT